MHDVPLHKLGISVPTQSQTDGGSNKESHSVLQRPAHIFAHFLFNNGHNVTYRRTGRQ